VTEERRDEIWALACDILKPVHYHIHDARVTEGTLKRLDEILGRAMSDLAKV
jgi:hypothetical protein